MFHISLFLSLPINQCRMPADSDARNPSPARWNRCRTPTSIPGPRDGETKTENLPNPIIPRPQVVGLSVCLTAPTRRGTVVLAVSRAVEAHHRHRPAVRNCRSRVAGFPARLASPRTPGDVATSTSKDAAVKAIAASAGSSDRGNLRAAGRGGRRKPKRMFFRVWAWMAERSLRSRSACGHVMSKSWMMPAACVCVCLPRTVHTFPSLVGNRIRDFQVGSSQLSFLKLQEGSEAKRNEAKLFPNAASRFTIQLG